MLISIYKHCTVVKANYQGMCCYNHDVKGSEYTGFPTLGCYQYLSGGIITGPQLHRMNIK
jgi:hypothetical protein